jgi:CRP-like cAMP-binding protein
MRAGQLLISAGAESNDVYFVVSGRVVVTLFAPTGREVSIRDIGKGAVFGELAAIDGGSRSATIVAASAGQLAIVPAQAFRQLLARNSEFSLWLLQHFAAQIRAMTDRIFELSSLPVRGRLQCELLRLAGGAVQLGDEIIIEPAPTHAELAARIGSQRESVSRELSYLSDLNILRQGRRKLTLVSLHRLVDELRFASGEQPGGQAKGSPC